MIRYMPVIDSRRYYVAAAFLSIPDSVKKI
jgi:hypothetical protein